MNKRTKKKLKAQISSLKNELIHARLQLYMNNAFITTPTPFKIKAVVHMSEALYPEQAYPHLKRMIMAQLDKEIDNFIETYKDNLMNEHVAYFQFIPTFRKEK